jgi:hypothetical protein
MFFYTFITLDLGWISCCKAEYSNQLRTGGITISLTRSQTMVTGSRSKFRIHGLISNQRIWFVWFSRSRKSVFIIPGWQLAPAQSGHTRNFTHGIHILVHGPPQCPHAGWQFDECRKIMNESDLNEYCTFYTGFRRNDCDRHRCETTE